MIIIMLPFYLLSWLPFKWVKPACRFLFHIWANAFLRFFGISLHVHQHYHGKLPKHYIAIANHPSVFEDIGMPMTFPEAHFLAKEEVRSWWFVGRMGAAVGTIFVQRECKDSRKKAREQLADAVRSGKSVAIFPEGGCKGRRIYTPFTSGAFDLSLETGVPIIPVLLHYEAQHSFEWLEQSLPRMLWELMWIKNKHVNYHIFDPLYPSQFKHRDHYRTHVESLFLKWQEKHFD